ncbi:tryptophan synthase beta subunit-like PLP-dependent enzyme [Tribonema minus]|uniref:threonine synthase n=1 Tax=Tribonema minus TaxID=303371 RepID=A0A835YRE7_9STRA|nr:tryptophan synthase beta subunit-like PLP-dependent enzyme [Tribonema minus]
MRYVSTRGGAPAVTFEHAVLSGWAQDGGMLLPERIPKIASATLEQWRELHYGELCEAVLRLFMAEDELPELKDVCSRAFAGFGSDSVVELQQLPGTAEAATATAAIHIAELWHGPSLAFKDLGMQVLCQSLQSLLTRNGSNDTRTVLISTSGDTGPSALQAVTDAPSLHCIVLYPIGRVSRVQEAQMLAQAGAANATVIACEGTSDDMDIPCAQVFEDAAFARDNHIGTVNSVNVLRLLVQVVHYFYAYLKVTAAAPGSPPPVYFSVPTGAAGNITAGVIARLMGLPAAGFLVAVNENDVMHRMLSTGVMEKSADVLLTTSPAMDIQAPYNVERLFHLLWRDGDPDKGASIRALMADFNSGERVPLPQHLKDGIAALNFKSVSVSNARAAAAIRTAYQADSYVLDPHTAVGVATAMDTILKNRRGIVVCMGCAHAAKFPETIQAALALPSLAEACRIIPNRDHKCVAATVAATDALSAGAAVQIEVFTKGKDWLARLKEVIREVTAQRAEAAGLNSDGVAGLV